MFLTVFMSVVLPVSELTRKVKGPLSLLCSRASERLQRFLPQISSHAPSQVLIPPPDTTVRLFFFAGS